MASISLVHPWVQRWEASRCAGKPPNPLVIRVARGLSVAGFYIEKEQGPVLTTHASNRAEDANIALVDGTVVLTGGGTAFDNRGDAFSPCGMSGWVART